MKKDFTRDFKEIKEMTNKIKSLNESINFADSYDDNDFDTFENDDTDSCENIDKEEQDDKTDEEKALETQGGADAINQIREIALKGMIQLCKKPNDPVYNVLKKIFSFCDKAITDKEDNDK